LPWDFIDELRPAIVISLGGLAGAGPMVEIEALRKPKTLGVGIYVKHSVTGEEAAVRPDVVFETQSVIKLALAIRSYQLAAEEWAAEPR